MISDKLKARKKQYPLVGNTFIMEELLSRIDPDLDHTNVQHILAAHNVVIRRKMKKLEEFSDGISGHYRLNKSGRKKFIERIEKNFNIKLRFNK